MDAHFRRRLLVLTVVLSFVFLIVSNRSIVHISVSSFFLHQITTGIFGFSCLMDVRMPSVTSIATTTSTVRRRTIEFGGRCCRRAGILTVTTVIPATFTAVIASTTVAAATDQTTAMIVLVVIRMKIK